MNELPLRERRLQESFDQLTALGATLKQQEYAIRQMLVDCYQLRIGIYDYLRTRIASTPNLPAGGVERLFHKECCGKVFNSQQSYKGHLNAGIHRKTKQQ